jgi:hypothetical protein
MAQSDHGQAETPEPRGALLLRRDNGSYGDVDASGEGLESLAVVLALAFVADRELQLSDEPARSWVPPVEVDTQAGLEDLRR